MLLLVILATTVLNRNIMARRPLSRPVCPPSPPLQRTGEPVRQHDKAEAGAARPEHG